MGNNGEARQAAGGRGMAAEGFAACVEVAAMEEDPDIRSRGGGIEHPVEHYDGE
jgi:hypothetical protein